MHEGKWEKRWHPLREEWIVYAAHRNARPWQGAPLLKPQENPQYDKSCYLCPTNTRVNGHTNPDYESVFVFDNDHPVVGMDAPKVETPPEDLYKKEKARGISRVICFDPRH